jgi:hypothetical protein
VKSFWGTSPNAVKVQIYTAISTYCLVVIVKSKLKSTRSNYEILQILSVALLDKIPLKELLSNPIYQDVKEQNYIQLNFDLF